jgi:hypothetical protein
MLKDNSFFNGIVNKNNNNLPNGQVRKKYNISLKLSASSLTEKVNPFYVTGFCDKTKIGTNTQNQTQKLVVFGTNLQSSVGEKFTRKELAMVRLAPYSRDVIVGLILSDG